MIIKLKEVFGKSPDKELKELFQKEMDFVSKIADLNTKLIELQNTAGAEDYLQIAKKSRSIREDIESLKDGLLVIEKDRVRLINIGIKKKQQERERKTTKASSELQVLNNEVEQLKEDLAKKTKAYADKFNEVVLLTNTLIHEISDQTYGLVSLKDLLDSPKLFIRDRNRLRRTIGEAEKQGLGLKVSIDQNGEIESFYDLVSDEEINLI